MSVTVNLYHNDEPDLIALKTPTIVGYATGAFKGEVNYLKPVIVIETTESEIAGANYFSVGGEVVRYFYIEEKTAITNTLWRISGRADLRMTYRAAIRNSAGIVDRNENNYNMYLNDTMIPVSARKTVSVAKFPITTNFSNKAANKTVTMLVMGGK